LLRDQILLAITLALVLAGLCALWYRHRGDPSVGPGYVRWCFAGAAFSTLLLWYPRLDTDGRTQLGFAVVSVFVVIALMLAVIGAGMRQEVYDDLRFAWWKWQCRRDERRDARRHSPGADPTGPG
jgi:hypothetical protein